MSVNERYSMIDSGGNRIGFTEIQKECIDYRGRSAFVTKGTAGSGKSLTLIKRAMMRRNEIIRNNLNERVMIFSYTNALINGIKFILESNGVKPNDEILQVSTVDNLLFHICRDLELIPKKPGSYSGRGRYGSHRERNYSVGGYFEGISDDVRASTVEGVLKRLSEKDNHRYFKLDPKFWADEILWMYRNGIVDQDDEEKYLKMSRSGRCKTYKVRMTQDGRKTAFKIFTEYNNSVLNKELIEWERFYALLFRDHVDRISGRHKYDYIFLDEAQDMTLVKMQIINELCKNELEIAMDKNQSLYGHRWRYIDCLGSVPHVKTLTMMHRGTKEIDEFSRDLKKVDDSLLDEEDVYDFELSTKTGNILPKIVKCSSPSLELNFILNEIRVLSEQNVNIAILCRYRWQLEAFNKKLKEEGINAEYYEDEGFNALTPGVKLITVHSAKGLGFAYVFVPYFQENVYPPSVESIIDSLKLTEFDKDSQTTIEEALTEEIAESRRLAYVAITRATGNVYLTYSGNPSPFIEEFDTNHYDLIDESRRKTTDSRIGAVHSEPLRPVIEPKPRSPYDYDFNGKGKGDKPQVRKESLKERKEDSIARSKSVLKPNPKSKTVVRRASGQKVVTRAEQEFEYEEGSPRGKLVSILQSADAEHIDFGPKASIWIIDGPEVASLIEHLESMKYSFKYSPNGNRSTGNRAAYYIWLK